ncbi:MAG: alpha/beta hydrolase [Bacteroidales bacterium]|nr:alpha/beta hydrolase [Bacteroidales bacterium]
MKKIIILLAAALMGASALYAQPAGNRPAGPTAGQRPAFAAPQASQTINAPRVEPDYVIDLWPNGAPTDNGLTGEERDRGTFAMNITKPTLSFFIPKKPNGMAVIICAGGGYSSVYYGTEGYANTPFFTDRGITVVVLKYRLPNGHPEVPLDDVQEAFRVVRERSAELGLKKIGVVGCSAGGHLATMAATKYKNAVQRPDFQILYYPVVTADPSFAHEGSIQNLVGRNNINKRNIDEYSNEKHVTPDTPPAFIMANTDDNVVPVRNSIEYYNALIANKVPASLNIYQEGGHGWTDHLDFPYREQWMDTLGKWLERLQESFGL